jgi:hypothetical protein
MKQRHRVPKLALLVLSTALLAACGGDDEDPAAAAANQPSGNNLPASGGNSAPRITGAPTTTVLQGNAYLFTPSATDADGNPLTFSVANLPGWATFNSSTGRISGTPTAAQVGTYSNITISVSDGSATASLPSFSIQVVALATGSVTLSWTPPTSNTDGSPLNDLAGYRVYWGTSPTSLSNSVTVPNAGLATYVVGQLTPAVWHFAVTAYTATGYESGYSNVASKTVQ